MGDQPIRVLIVDDEAIVRKGLTALLNEYSDILIIGDAADGHSANELVKRLKPDVVLLDLLTPILDGIETIHRIIAIQPDQRIIVLTAYAWEDTFIKAIKAGAMGYLLKNIHPEELIQAIRKVYAGEPYLNPEIAWKILRGMNGAETSKRPAVVFSERETAVLRLLTLGKTDKEIAEELILGEVTIRTHISRILPKLGVNNRVQAALYGIRSGLVSLSETNDLNRFPNGF